MDDWCFKPQFCTGKIYWRGDRLVNEMNFDMNHAPGAGSIARPVTSSLAATTVPRLLQQLSRTPVQFRKIKAIEMQHGILILSNKLFILR